MNKYLVTVQLLCQKEVYVEAKDEAEAEEKALAGQGIMIGNTYRSVKYQAVDRVVPTNLEID